MPDNPCGGFAFNKIAGMDSRPAFLLKKVPIKDEFSALLQSGQNVNSDFGKSASCALQGRTLLKQCYTISILKNVFLRRLVFGTFSEKNVQSVHCRLATLLK